jgi:putative colanic acid biosynthesis acetyltransferase WcaF
MNNTSSPEIDLTQSVSQWPIGVFCRRLLWQGVLKPLFRVLPGPANGLRIGLLRMMGANIGKRCLVSTGVDVLMPWNLELASCVALGKGVRVYNYDKVRIGRMTLVSQGAHLCTGSHDHTHPHMPLIWKPILIGEQCWIAAEAFLVPGVVVGNGCVVGARSVVTKNLPEWTVCAGNPCVPVKPRAITT